MKKRLVIFFLAAAMVLGGCENKNSKLYKKGIEAIEQKDYVTSIAMLEGAVKAGDRLAESYRSLGIAYLKSQEYDKAKEAFKSSLLSMKHKDAEFSRDVMYYEAETCVQAGDLDGAIEICTNIQEEKADADALFLRGRAYFLQKNYEQAKVDFDAAVETKESYQLCLDIYELYQESSMKADGDRYLEAAVKIEPKTTEDYYNIGCAYYYLEEQDEAAARRWKCSARFTFPMVRTTRRKHCFLRIFRQMALRRQQTTGWRSAHLRKTTRTVHSRISRKDSKRQRIPTGKICCSTRLYPMKNGRILIPRSR